MTQYMTESILSKFDVLMGLWGDITPKNKEQWVKVLG